MDIEKTVIEHLEQAAKGLDLLVSLAQYRGETDERAAEAARKVRLALDEMRGKADEALPPLEQAIQQAIIQARSVWLSVWRKDGHNEVVLFEPYRIEHDPRRGKVLVCYHVEHGHPEKLAWRDIRYMSGWGGYFTPREAQ